LNTYKSFKAIGTKKADSTGTTVLQILGTLPDGGNKLIFENIASDISG